MKYKKPVTRMSGINRFAIRQKLGRIHVSHTILDAMRHVRPKEIRQLPVPLRRGFTLCVVETWREYQDLYTKVMG